MYIQFTDSLDNIVLPDEKQSVLHLDSVSQTLRILGAPVEPVLNLDSDLFAIETLICIYC